MNITEKDVKTYYMTREKTETVESYMNRILQASTMEEAVQAYLDMKTCISKDWIELYLNKQTMVNGKLIQMKNLPFLKTVINESKKYIIASFDVIMGIQKKPDGQVECLSYTKQEILPAGTDQGALELFHKKREFYHKINQAIETGDIKTLESNYAKLETDPCYVWTIEYFGLQKPLQLNRDYFPNPYQNN